MAEFALEDMDFEGAYNYDMDAIDKEDEVVLTLGSGSGSGSGGGGGGKAGSRQVYGATPAPGPRHRRRRSSFLVSHGVSSFWYGLCSVALLVIVLVSPCSLVFLCLSSPISLNDPSIHPVFCITNYPSTSWHEHFHTIPHRARAQLRFFFCLLSYFFFLLLIVSRLVRFLNSAFSLVLFLPLVTVSLSTSGTFGGPPHCGWRRELLRRRSGEVPWSRGGQFRVSWAACSTWAFTTGGIWGRGFGESPREAPREKPHRTSTPPGAVPHFSEVVFLPFPFYCTVQFSVPPQVLRNGTMYP
ncbi:hypothetical protein CMUS01_11646 [Colletotrichum musicola]|uniref:Uncharacterized protein n=1 Tax=Colletotrichum musicola TaxID=2175873 RepID=A0A8H6N571_9PEZI|nr:hypothetical protein CMUS01_11646 [Colletotrichum musicola]